MGVNISFYLPVSDPAAALDLARDIGFEPHASLGLEDPYPAIVGEASELERKFLCRAFLDVASAGGYLRYWTFDRWPMSAAEGIASLVVVERVEQICRLVGANAFVCLPDTIGPDDLSPRELREETRALGERNAALLFGR